MKKKLVLEEQYEMEMKIFRAMRSKLGYAVYNEIVAAIIEEEEE